jgi:hypothetical protein
MTPRAALSPAWLGVFAVSTFGGLVLASFASGYHLVMKSPPRSEPAPVVIAEPPPPPVVAAPAAAPKPKAPTPDPAEAVVRPNLTPDRARVFSKPHAGVVVARLPSNQRVAVRGRDGEWLRIEFDRKGKRVIGWTPESNLILR